MSNMVPLAMRPRILRHDVTDIDLASRIRQGLVTREEIAERFEHAGFSDWFNRQGFEIYKYSIVNSPGTQRPAQPANDEREIEGFPAPVTETIAVPTRPASSLLRLSTFSSGIETMKQALRGRRAAVERQMNEAKALADAALARWHEARRGADLALFERHACKQQRLLTDLMRVKISEMLK